MAEKWIIFDTSTLLDVRKVLERMEAGCPGAVLPEEKPSVEEFKRIVDNMAFEE